VVTEALEATEEAGAERVDGLDAKVKI
jgi:hypothetical protein